MAGNILGALQLLLQTKADTSGLTKTDSALKKTQKTLQTVGKTGGFLKKALGLAGLGLGANALKNTFQAYLQFEKDYGAMQSRFFAITQDHKKADEEFQWVKQLAIDTAQNIKSTADSYSIFYSATQKSLGTEGARGVYTAWAKVGRVLHLSEYQMERVTYALREMTSKGAIYSQDLRMQIGTHVPNAMGIAQKAAEEMGITGTNWFEKLQSAAKGNNKVTAEFVKNFSKYAQQMYGSESAFREAMRKPDALANQISNLRESFLYSFSDAGGSYMIVKILEATYKVLLKIPYNKIADGMGKVARVTGNVFEFLSNHIPQIISLLGIIAGTYAGRALTADGAFLGKGGFARNTKAGFLRLFARGGLNRMLRGSALWKFLQVPITLRTMPLILKGIGVGLRAFFGRVLAFFGGPVGLGISLIITFLPQILGFLGKIFSALNQGKDTWQNRFGDLTPEQAKNIALSIQKHGVTSQKDLDRQLSWYQGGEKLHGALTYVDNKHVEFTFNESSVSAENIPNIANNYDQNDKKNTANIIFNNPGKIKANKAGHGGGLW